MQLERSRTALRQATQHVEELRAAKNSPDLFRDRFPFVMAAVQRVGSFIDQETKGYRTQAFGMWWKEMQSDPLFAFMRDVRNAEFRRGESRQAARHYVTLGGVEEPEGALSFKVIQGGKVIQEGQAQSEAPREPFLRHPYRIGPSGTSQVVVTTTVRKSSPWLTAISRGCARTSFRRPSG